MILIFSSSRDQATNGVLPWLDRLGQIYLRVNDDEPLPDDLRVELTNEDFRFHIGGVWRALADVSAVWYRKGTFWFPPGDAGPAFEGQAALTSLLARKLKDEARAAGRHFHELVRLSGTRVLGNPVLGDPNKLVVLGKAQRLGLKVPRFEIIDRLSPRHTADLSAYVTKSMSDGVYLWDMEDAWRGYFSYTEDLAVAAEGLVADEAFPPSMLQQKIAKTFEVRAFYLDGVFASCAIYSQRDPQTATDYRKYNAETPNRNVPMALPVEVEDRLRALFDDLALNTGSVDMIVDSEGDYVFLEINPVGIYGGMQAACNYRIDRAIARWLSGEIDHDWC